MVADQGKMRLAHFGSATFATVFHTNSTSHSTKLYQPVGFSPPPFLSSRQTPHAMRAITRSAMSVATMVLVMAKPPMESPIGSAGSDTTGEMGRRKVGA